jgi:RecA/RadA recombinase
MKGLDASVLFVDTTNTFRPERIVSMARHSDLDEKVLDKIYLHKVYSTADQMATVERASRLHNLKLVIVDSVSDLFSFEYKQSLSAERHMKFMRLMRELALLAINSNSAVVVTNNIRFADGAQREYLDKSISSFAHMRVEISRADHLFRARLLRPSLDPCSALYSISEKGIADV